MTRFYHRLRRYMPALSVWFFLSALLALGLQISFVLSAPFADWFNQNISAALRAFFAHLTGWFPFSLAETLVISIPVIFVALLMGAFRISSISTRRVVYFILGLFSVLAMEYTMFVLTFSPAYQGTKLEEKLHLPDNEVTAYQLAETASILLDNIDLTLDDVTFRFEGSSVMPYSYDELSALLVEAYDNLCSEYTFIQKLDSRVKPIALSSLYTYTHISGVYTYFTGEANLNTNYPDYVIPFTAAHEMAHQRGIAREDEANFIAFLVCLSSDDPYIRYSGLMNMYDYIANALYSASSSYYKQIYYTLDSRVYYEELAYSDFFDEYRENVVATVSNAVNNTYLTIQGTEGTKSYDRVVELCVAFFVGLQQ